MTSIENAMADNSTLGEYRGRQIIKTKIAIGNSGDGLSKAMGIKPQVLEPGDTVMVLLECVVTYHKHELDEESGCYELVQKLRAGTATIVDDNTSASKLRKQADAIQKAHDAAKGQDRLDGTDADDLEPSEGELAAVNGNGAAENTPDLSAFNGDPEPVDA